LQLFRAIRYCERVKILTVEMPFTLSLSETDSFRLLQRVLSEVRRKISPSFAMLIDYDQSTLIDRCNHDVVA